MSYLMIESRGVADKESFTMLGASTARGKADKIGMFGSGATHATLCCLRHGLDVHIFSDTTRLLFFTKSETINGEYAEVVYSQFGNRKPEQRDYSIDFGAHDWRSLDMALREYISNAIDACGWDDVMIRKMDSPRARRGYTRIFVPMTTEVLTYYTQLKEKFLHASNRATTQLIPNNENRQAKIYRKGVFVRQVAKHWHPSLFDYNFGDSLPIDESRNMDDYKARGCAASMVAKNRDALQAIFKKFQTTKDFWEAEFTSYTLDCGYHDVWKAAFESVYGKNGIVTSTALMIPTLQAKGYNVCFVTEGWYAAMKSHGIRVDMESLNHVEQNGCSMVPVTEPAQSTFDKVWLWLCELGVTNGRSKPALECFNKTMEGGALLKGHYKNNTVYLNTQSENDQQTIMEELAHHITGSTDNSRDFQDFAFLVATLACKVIFE